MSDPSMIINNKYPHRCQTCKARDLILGYYKGGIFLTDICTKCDKRLWSKGPNPDWKPQETKTQVSQSTDAS